MRAKSFLTFVTAIAIGFAIKLSFFSGPAASVNALQSSRMDVATMQASTTAPVETVRDMTFDSSGAN